VNKAQYRCRFLFTAAALCFVFSITVSRGSADENFNKRSLDQEIAAFSVPSSVSALTWSPDGRYLVVSYDRDRKISLFDPRTGRRSWTVQKLTGIDPPPQKVLQFSPDSRLIYTSSADTAGPQNRDHTLSVISVSDGSVVRTLRYRVPPPNRAPAIAAALAASRDGARLYAIPSETGEIVAYDTSKWEVAQTYDLGTNSYPTPLVIDEERDLIFVAKNRLDPENQKIQILRLGSGEEVRTFESFQVSTRLLALNPRTHEIVTGGESSFEGRADRRRGQMLYFHDDSRTLVRAYDATGQKTHVYPGPGGSVAGLSMSSDGMLIAASKQRILAVPPDIAARFGCASPSQCETPSHSYLLIWNAENNELIASKDYGQAFLGDLEFSPDGNSLAYAVESRIHIVRVRR